MALAVPAACTCRGKSLLKQTWSLGLKVLWMLHYPSHLLLQATEVHEELLRPLGRCQADGQMTWLMPSYLQAGHCSWSCTCSARGRCRQMRDK